MRGNPNLDSKDEQGYGIKVAPPRRMEYKYLHPQPTGVNMGTRKGFLTPKTYFPKRGDVLENAEEGVSWECARGNTHTDERTGVTIRYCLLVAHIDDIEEPVIETINDQIDMRKWMSEFDSIYRDRNGKQIRYDRHEEGHFVEV